MSSQREPMKAHVCANEHMHRKKRQFGIALLMGWTAIIAVSLAAIKFAPILLITLSTAILAFAVVGPFAIILTVIVFSPEKNGRLQLSYRPIKVLIGTWVLCVFLTATLIGMIFFGVIY